MSIDRQLRTGGDPRALADYGLLSEELSKLSHPARPDVDWKKAETLCLNLFRQNGIELQTAAWYTQARTQLVGIRGMNEGLAILEALISRQWPGLWPQPVHARIEILTGLSQRLQQSLRTMTLEYHDLAQIYHAEKSINTLCEILQHLELKHVSQLGELGRIMHCAATRLENLHSTTNIAVVLPAHIGGTATVKDTPQHQPWIYIGQQTTPDPQVIIAALPARTRPIQWKGFMFGVLLTVLIGGGIKATVDHVYRPSPAEQRITMLSMLLKPMDTTTRIAATPLLNANAIPLKDLNSWCDANEQLQQLADKLNALDGQRGRYMTGSELKTAVFTLQKTLGKSPPVEESLREIAQEKQQGITPSTTTVLQLDNKFRQLLDRYALLVGE